MSNDTSKSNNVDLSTCDPSACSGFGTCKILNPGMSIEWHECICDLWHSGQKCEFEVPLPLVVAVACTFFAAVILYFCWCSSYKFSKRKIRIPQDRRRFVDHLHKHQQHEKQWLRKKLDEENKRIGKTRDIPLDEQTDLETEKDSKDKKNEENKEEEKKEVLKRPEPNRERELQKLKEEETANQMRADLVQMKKEKKEKTEEALDLSRKVTTSASVSISTSMSGGGPMELAEAASNTTNALPEDAPKDNKEHHKQVMKLEKKQEKWAEMESAELNKKNKKKLNHIC